MGIEEAERSAGLAHIEREEKTATSDSALNDLLSVGDIVIPLNYALRSGCTEYDKAIVVKKNPLMLVSEHADMMWGITLDGYKFKVVGNADKKLLEKCMTRLNT